MTPQTNATETRTKTRSVFDLTTFDTVTLTKEVAMPARPTSVDEALVALGNDKEKLLDVIHEGLCGLAMDAANNSMDGFVNEDGEAFKGTFADEDKKKSIDLAILNIAKSGGYDKSLPLEKRKALKEQARNFIRSNPAMLAFIAGTPIATATEPSEPTA